MAYFGGEVRKGFSKRVPAIWRLFVSFWFLGECLFSMSSNGSNDSILKNPPRLSLEIYCNEGAPFQVLNADGSLGGTSVEMVREIQKRVSNTDPIQVVPWARGYQYLQTRSNVVLFSTAQTKERMPLFRWIGPLAVDTMSLFTRADSKIAVRNLEDAKKIASIGIGLNDVVDRFLSSAGFNNLQHSVAFESRIKMLMSGRVEAIVMPASGMSVELARVGFSIQNVKNIFPVLNLQFYVAMSKGMPDEIVKEWSEAFSAIRTKKGL